MKTNQTVIWLNYWWKEKRIRGQTIKNITTDEQGHAKGEWVTDGGSIVNVTKSPDSDAWRES